MKYERLTHQKYDENIDLTKEYGYSYIYKRLYELEDKIEAGTLVELSTTEKTKRVMARTFDNAQWATRDPKVQKGTTVTGDNYWKGEHDEANALLMTKTYGAPDPYALTEMEDIALAVVLDRYNLLDKYIVIRDSVNMDIFMYGSTPESLWSIDDSLASDDSVESADIFATARKNNFLVGSQVVDAIVNGTL